MKKTFFRKAWRALALLMALGILCYAGLIALVYYWEVNVPNSTEYDGIIVLGAQVKEDGTPSVALERRLTAALESYQADQQLVIVCGAQGSNEPRAEGDVMRDWLLARGVPEGDVVAETASFNTRENLTYAKAIAPYCKHLHVFQWKGSERFPLRQGLKEWQAYLRCFEGERTLLLEFMPDDLMSSLPAEASALGEIIGGSI